MTLALLPRVEDMDRAWDGGPPYHWPGRVFYDPNFAGHLFYEQSLLPYALGEVLWVQPRGPVSGANE